MNDVARVVIALAGTRTIQTGQSIEIEIGLDGSSSQGGLWPQPKKNEEDRRFRRIRGGRFRRLGGEKVLEEEGLVASTLKNQSAFILLICVICGSSYLEEEKICAIRGFFLTSEQTSLQYGWRFHRKNVGR